MQRLNVLTMAGTIFLLSSVAAFANGLNEDGSWQFKSANQEAVGLGAVTLMQERKAGGFGVATTTYGGSTTSIGNITTYTDSNGNVTSQTNTGNQASQNNYKPTGTTNGGASTNGPVTVGTPINLGAK